jgi:hypothetical protein
VAQSDADFLTYCAMCRDQLAKTGKPVLHILDLLVPGAGASGREPPAGISLRRVNRRMLKTAVLERYGQTGMPRQPWEDVRLDISKSVAAVLEDVVFWRTICVRSFSGPKRAGAALSMVTTAAGSLRPNWARSRSGWNTGRSGTRLRY